MPRIIVAVFFFVLAFLPGLAVASPFTWTFGGTVSGVGFFASAVPDPIPIRFDVTFDSEAVNQCAQGFPNAGTGFYSGSATMTLLGSTLGGGAFIESSAPLGNCSSSGGGVAMRVIGGASEWSGSVPLFEIPLSGGGSMTVGIPWAWTITPLPAALVPGGLPQQPAPGAWSLVYAEWGGLGFPGNGFRGDLAFVPVPEPSVLLLSIAGIVAAGAWRSKRGQR